MATSAGGFLGPEERQLWLDLCALRAVHGAGRESAGRRLPVPLKFSGTSHCGIGREYEAEGTIARSPGTTPWRPATVAPGGTRSSRGRSPGCPGSASVTMTSPTPFPRRLFDERFAVVLMLTDLASCAASVLAAFALRALVLPRSELFRRAGHVPGALPVVAGLCDHLSSAGLMTFAAFPPRSLR